MAGEENMLGMCKASNLRETGRLSQDYKFKPSLGNLFAD